MAPNKSENTVTSETPLANTVALIGVVLLGFALALGIVLFILVGKLPDGIEEVRQLKSTGPAQLQLLILVCSTAVLNLVAFLLCTVGLFLPNRPRLLAAIGTSVSAILLLALFGVLVVGTLMNPAAG